MARAESRREMVHRHIRRQEDLIVRQRQLIEKLAAAGDSTRLAGQVLESMESTLALLEQINQT